MHHKNNNKELFFEIKEILISLAFSFSPLFSFQCYLVRITVPLQRFAISIPFLKSKETAKAQSPDLQTEFKGNSSTSGRELNTGPGLTVPAHDKQRRDTDG